MQKRASVGYQIVLWLVALAFFAPVVYIATSMFKTRDQILEVPPKLIFTPTLENILNMFSRPVMAGYFIHSLVISTSSVLIAILVSILAAYVFSRYQPRGTGFLMFLLLSMRMVPGAAVVIPVYLMYVALGWKDSLPGMILFYAMFSIPFSVWIIKGFMDSVSTRFDETALVNGASRLHIIFRVVLPQIWPAVVAAFIFNLVFVWNEFLFNYIVGGKRTAMVPVALAQWFHQGGIDWTFVATITTLHLIVPFLVILFFQKYLLVGMTFGTVRGEV